MNQLPRDVQLCLIDCMDVHEVLRLRKFGSSLPQCLHILLSARSLFTVLKRLPNQDSIRPALTEFQNTPLGRKDLLEREEAYWNQYNVTPCKQLRRTLEGMRSVGRWHTKQAYTASIIRGFRPSALPTRVAVLDIISNTLVVLHFGRTELKYLTLTSELLAFSTADHVFIIRLAVLPHSERTVTIDLRATHIARQVNIRGAKALAGNKSQIAIAEESHLTVYDYITHRTTSTDMAPTSNVALSWDQELCCVYKPDVRYAPIQIWLPQRQRTITPHTIPIPTACQISESGGTIQIRIKPRSTGGKTNRSYSSYIVTQDLKVEDVSQGTHSWRETLYVAQSRNARIYAVRSQEHVATIHKGNLPPLYLSCTDSFMVIIEEGYDKIRINVLSIDTSIVYNGLVQYKSDGLNLHIENHIKL